MQAVRGPDSSSPRVHAREVIKRRRPFLCSGREPGKEAGADGLSSSARANGLIWVRRKVF